VPAIQTHDLRKRYRGVEALRGVSIRVAPGEVYGLLGPNGAGKTTLVKILLGIVRPTGGAATLLGRPAGDAAARRRVGYLPEDHRFPEYHTAASLLDFYGELYGVPARDRRKRIPAALERVGLADRMHSKVRTYSKGMKQRLGIAQALFHRPELVFLDEPTDGVDPVGRHEIRGILQELKGQGVTVFLNSHLLSEVELLCDRVAILRRGLLAREGTVADLTRQRNLYVIGLADAQPLPADELRAAGYEVRPAGAFWEVTLRDGQSIDPVVDLLRGRGLGLRHLVEKRQTLEETFMQTVDVAEPADDRPVVPGARAVPAVLPVRGDRP
jgi:ABC-2 type transport system ATP-binding protein